MSFIPKEFGDSFKGGGGRNDYLSPSKIKADGQVRFALLVNEPLCYYEVWGEDETGKGKPFRFPQEASPSEIEEEMGANYRRRTKDDGTEEPQRFAIAMPIYNFDAKRIQVLSITQKGIQKELDEISQVEEYEDMTTWDFVMTKSATVSPDMYGLRPVPRKASTQEAVDAAWDEAVKNGFDISRLLTGGHPFKAD
ncbi:hypothetical protein [Limnobacter sp.]|uniref:hypothetical protein n=1 Tax=Limnobacter sp. TaxID=2003368 RepID=UPI0025C001FC|nr:hypothetical protein [Limnobacter sp.]